MKLIRVENYELKVEDELLLLKPFRKRYIQDKSKDKGNFLNFLMVLYYVYDPRSDFQYIIDENQRIEEVCKANGIRIPKFDSLEKECIELYKKMCITVSSELLRRTRIAIDKVGTFLENVDLDEVDDKGKPKYTINSITSTIKQIPQLAKDLAEAEKALKKDLEESGRARGGQDNKTLMDDGIWKL